MVVRPHVVIVGSGFAGLNAAMGLATAPVDITIVDRDNYHGFWPLLYQVATAAISAHDIARPIRSIYARYPNVRVRLGTITGVDLDARVVEREGGRSLRYDFLILAAGSSTSDFGVPGVEEFAFPLKTLPDAVRLRNHILTTFEQADSDGLAADPGALTIVLIGGGPTGVELAGALAELVGRNLARDFPDLDLTQPNVVLVEMTDHLLAGFSPGSQAAALETLQQKGVDVRFHTKLAKVTADGVSFGDGTSLPARTVVWTAGVKANALAEVIPGSKGQGGTVTVSPDLSVPGYPEVFVIGDMAAAAGDGGTQLPQLAQVAIQGGRHVACNIRRRLVGEPTKAFRYHDHGIMATIGRRVAVAELPGGFRFRGTFGWLLWLAVHLTFLVGFRNRAVVVVNWVWSYLTWDRTSRVILEAGSRAPAGRLRG